MHRGVSVLEWILCCKALQCALHHPTCWAFVLYVCAMLVPQVLGLLQLKGELNVLRED
uniref:Uncharacterized protein n=1 Tax=Physcomitrium patens TaxID=3218 RepID=A0A7I4D2S6_PHYPA